MSQSLALFVKVIKKLSKRLQDVQKAAISATMPDARAAATRTDDTGNKASFAPLATSLEDELAEAGDEASRALREKQRAMIDALDLTKCVPSSFARPPSYLFACFFLTFLGPFRPTRASEIARPRGFLRASETSGHSCLGLAPASRCAGRARDATPGIEG